MIGRPKPPPFGLNLDKEPLDSEQTQQPETLFTKIIAGDIPGEFVWQDETCVVFLTIGPLTEGHALVVPRSPVDKWTDLPPDLMAHLMQVAQIVGRAQLAVFGGERVGLIIAGFEIPHAHIHIFPATGESQFDFAKAGQATPEQLADAGARLRAALREADQTANVPQD